MKVIKILTCVLLSWFCLIGLSPNAYAQRVRTICKNCLPGPSVSVSPGAAVASGQLPNGVSNVALEYRGSKSSGQVPCAMSGQIYNCQLSGLNVGAYQVDIKYSLDGSTFFTTSTDFKVLSQAPTMPCEINNNTVVTATVNENTRHATLNGSGIPACIGTVRLTQVQIGFGYNWVTNPIDGNSETESWNYAPVNFPVSNGSFNQLITRGDGGGPLAPKEWRMNTCFLNTNGGEVGCKVIQFTVPPSNLAVCSGNIDRPPQPSVNWEATELSDLLSSTTFPIPEGVTGIDVQVQKNGNPTPVWLYNAYHSANWGDFQGSVVDLSELSGGELQTVSAIRLRYHVLGSTCFIDNDGWIQGDWVTRY